ncbi:thioredoxin family protein [Empedobacter tilapiae]|uniref:Thioredoxin n=1 Tax=Empedobacter tilapiae TaxID=2491114 RepID=A0A4Z1BSP3_9FLAO|nr:thioredoxin family protein [Empedobacter tilapiae]TGN28009.1 thioredoxin [Empedobacter tilapiae]
MSNIETKNPETESLELLQFYAEWCQPCRMMMPVIASIQQKQYDWLTIKQIDVDAESIIANQFNIRSIPTFVAIKNNKEVWRKAGMINENELLEILRSLK